MDSQEGVAEEVGFIPQATSPQTQFCPYTFSRTDRYIVVMFSLLAITALVAIFLPEPNYSNRKALIIGIDGAKGTTFDYVVFNTSLAPNLRRLFAEGVGTRCVEPDAMCARTHG